MRHGRGKPAPLPRHPERSRARRDRNQDRVHRRNGPRPAHRQPLLRVAGPQAASARSATAVCRACPRDHAAGTGTAVMKASDEDREGLRQTFNQAAGSYQRARPDYPGELFDDLVTVAGLAPGDRLLEIGCATGKATFPLARRGFQVTCIELGADLAALARRNLDGLGVEVIEGRFEDWRPAAGQHFDLVFAATAWNWIDPARRYALAWRALRPGGHLAFWNALHVFPDGGARCAVPLPRAPLQRDPSGPWPAPWQRCPASRGSGTAHRAPPRLTATRSRALRPRPGPHAARRHAWARPKKMTYR